MAQLRDEAEALALGLEVGAVGRHEVTCWADAKVLQQDSPHWTLCDVAVAAVAYPQDLAGLLRSIPGETSPSSAIRLLIQLLVVKWDRGSLPPKELASVLGQLWPRLENQRLQGLASYAWDALDLAEEGLIEQSSAEIVRDLDAALHEAAHEAMTVGPRWEDGTLRTA